MYRYVYVRNIASIAFMLIKRKLKSLSSLPLLVLVAKWLLFSSTHLGIYLLPLTIGFLLLC